MQHSFDINIATKYGVHAAILFNNIYFWVEKNRANNRHFYDGYYWTYNSKKAFSELFPYMTERQVEYALKKLLDSGVIIKGKYNATGYDHTAWYAITKVGYRILQNCEINNNAGLEGEEAPEPAKNVIPQNCEIIKTKLWDHKNKIVRPIPYINSSVNALVNKGAEKTKETKNRKTAMEHLAVKEHLENKVEDEEIKGKIFAILSGRVEKGKAITMEFIRLLLEQLEKYSQGIRSNKLEILNRAIMNDYPCIYPLNDFQNTRKTKDPYRERENHEPSYDIDEYENYDFLKENEDILGDILSGKLNFDGSPRE